MLVMQALESEGHIRGLAERSDFAGVSKVIVWGQAIVRVSLKFSWSV